MTGCPATADDTPKAHAVYSTDGRMDNAYCYDAVGNMVHRATGTLSQTLVYDEENRLKYLYNDPNSVNAIASFAYDGDGNRVRATMGGIITLYAGGHVEYRIEAGIPNTETLVSYYMGGSQRIAMREQIVGGSDALYFLLGDHLGSTSATLDEDGVKVADLRYAAWGTQRWSSGDTPTRRRYTGQIQDVETGLYFYNARYYDPVLARFIQADTFVPDPNNPQTLNRFSYTNNNPVNYTDPTGHCLGCIIIGGIIITSKVIDYGLTTWDIIESFNTIRNPEASNLDITLAQLNIILAFGLEAVEPDDALPVGVPVDDAIRRGAVRAARDALLSGDDELLKTLPGWMQPIVRGLVTEHRIIEKLTDIVKNTSSHTVTITGRNGIQRDVTTIPDIFSEGQRLVGEIKDVASLGWDSQIQAQYRLALEQGWTYRLYIRRNTVLEGELRDLVNQGLIEIKYIEDVLN